MDTWEFFCNACEQPFSRKLTEEEYKEGGVLCPYCDSEDVEVRLTAFYPVNSREAA